MKFCFSWLMAVAVFQGCAGTPEEIAGIESQPDKFRQYWYQGKAEINRFALTQARYGERHEGDAVMIFVTEDFLAGKQVKKERGNDPAYSVLKLNFTRNFTTGIYPYSLMTSVFTKADFDALETPKATFTAQEWCGHVYMQMNLDKKGYRTVIHSYFQNEGDQDLRLPRAVLEDEIWTGIRVAPHKLPTGEFEMIPSMQYSRLMHRDPAPRKVKATLVSDRFADRETYVYEVTYKEPDRRLRIFFEKEFPYAILGWRDTYTGGFGPNARELTTEAVRTHVITEAYWGKNKPADRELRKSLGLD